jgi:hypothetical protein
VYTCLCCECRQCSHHFHVGDQACLLLSSMKFIFTAVSQLTKQVPLGYKTYISFIVLYSCLFLRLFMYITANFHFFMAVCILRFTLYPAVLSEAVKWNEVVTV